MSRDMSMHAAGYLGKYLSFCSSVEGVSKLFLKICMDTFFKITCRGKSKLWHQGLMTSKLPYKITIGYIGMQGCYLQFILCRLSAHQPGTITICTKIFRIVFGIVWLSMTSFEERELKQHSSRLSKNVNPQCPQRSHHPHMHQAHQPSLSMIRACSRLISIIIIIKHLITHYPHHHTAPPHLPH